jgi:hypothetical protein
MEAYIKNILLWLSAGLLLGLALSALFLLPLQPRPEAPSQANQLPQNQTPQNNAPPSPPPQAEKKEVNITMIEAPGCDLCNSEGFLLEQTKIVLLQSSALQAGVSRSIPYSSAEASALISKYNITELPAVIIEGPVRTDSEFVSAWQAQIGTLEGANALVTRFRFPPYYDIRNHTVVGLVEGIGIKASGCLECGDPALFMASLEGGSMAMVFSNQTLYEENDTEAQALLTRYNITKLPALLLSADGASAYPAFSQIKTLGTVEPDGWFVLRDVVPPYIDLTANHTLRGLVHAVYLVNSSCADCFDVASLSLYISGSSGLVLLNETTYETNSTEGSALMKKYNITAVPALLYSSDARYYPDFEDVWKQQNSTVESDGWFVFRAHGLLGDVVYQNVSG